MVKQWKRREIVLDPEMLYVVSVINVYTGNVGSGLIKREKKRNARL